MFGNNVSHANNKTRRRFDIKTIKPDVGLILIFRKKDFGWRMKIAGLPSMYRHRAYG